MLQNKLTPKLLMSQFILILKHVNGEEKRSGNDC